LIVTSNTDLRSATPRDVGRRPAPRRHVGHDAGIVLEVGERQLAVVIGVARVAHRSTPLDASFAAVWAATARRAGRRCSAPRLVDHGFHGGELASDATVGRQNLPGSWLLAG
jgi:hypothetical protein